jgi:NADH-quinone oxidoreductase subunit M
LDSLPILSLITFSPLAGALIILFWFNAPDRAVRWIALIASLASFFFSLLMVARFDIGSGGMQLT